MILGDSYNLRKSYNLHKTNKILFIIFFLYVKMPNKYQNCKEKLQKEARERYQNLSEEEKSHTCEEGGAQLRNFFGIY